MKIGRFLESGKETFGLVKNGHVATREEITYETGVPLPYSIKDFLFDGWFEEIKKKSPTLTYNENLSKYTILAPIPNPPKIICLAFNYIDHAEEQKIQPPKDPVIVMKPRTTLTGTNSEIRSPNFVKKLDYEDLIQYFSAIHSGCDFIITRNKKDFPVIGVKFFSPDDFLKI